MQQGRPVARLLEVAMLPLRLFSLCNRTCLLDHAWVGIALVVAALGLACSSVLAQQAENPTRNPADIISDNLDRVSASADQILESLNKDAGLMVEFKRLVAQDAGASGQIMEESDISDAAIGERLRDDLHIRVLATHLLQRYGYLLPHFNPGTDAAAEHALLQQARMQRIAQTGTDSQKQAAGERLPEQGRSQRVMQRAAAGAVRENSGPDTLSAPAGSFSGAKPSGKQETLLASAHQRKPEADLAGEERSSTAARANWLLPPSPSDLDLPTGTSGETIASSEADTAEPPAAGRERKPNSYASLPGLHETVAPAGDFDAARMERQPNPYAAVPSLYDLYVQAATPSRGMERFGMDVFRRGPADSDLLPMDLPVGPEYVVGPGDSLSISLWGGVSQRLTRTVDREGRVALPEAGPLLVSGKTLGSVQEEVQRVLRTQFHDVSADVSLQRLRTVRVYVVGDIAEPGAYDISSLSTPLNALFTAGGVTARGSLRRLEHYRGKQLVEEVDGYDLLLHGIRGDLQRLESGDSLRVPPLGPTVTVDGMVRRPAIYELRAEKNLEDVLDLAGGILPAAALRHIEVQRLVVHDRRTMLSLDTGETSDVEALRASLRKFAVQDGDEIHIFPIAPYNESAVYLQGHVLRPGRYSYREGMKLTDVISSYKDLLPEPARGYGEIIRIAEPDHRPVIQGFDLAAALAHPEKAPKLEALDTIRIFGRFDFEPLPQVMVTGEVRSPGRYRTSGEQHVRDAIYQAGGVTQEASLESGQLFRALPDGSTKVFSVSLREAFAGDPLNNLLLQPRDRILVHRQPQRISSPSVYVRGDVPRPGRYPLTSEMRVSDLVRSAGGLLRSANAAGSDLAHYAAASGMASGTQPAGGQSVNISAALAGEAAADVPLRDGDVLTVPQQMGWKDIGATMTLRGEVVKPGVYGIQPGERLSSLLQRAGGLTRTAYPQAAVFERVQVRQLQAESRQELIQRMEQESVAVKASVTATGAEELAQQQAAAQQHQRAIEAMRRAPVTGRMVVHLRQGQKGFTGSANDIELREGDVLQIPKQPGFVLIAGQVYNANAISYTAGKNAAWYLAQAGGATDLANKRAIFIIRANGMVTSGNAEFWSGGARSSSIGPGDTIVVPEKAILGGNHWRNILAMAQIAQAGALAAAVAIP
jgi:polysaccharide export outer membrane protein